MAINGMEITDVVVYPLKTMSTIEGNKKVVAFAKVTLNDQFIIQGIRIIKGHKITFVSFPDSCQSTTKVKAFTQYIKEHVLAEYESTKQIEGL